MTRRLALAALVALIPAIAGAADQAQHKKGGGESFIQMDTLTATIVRPDGRRGVMTIEVGVDAPDPALHARALASTPLLRANYFEVLRSYASGLPPGAPPD